jgi:hypothetical protein
MIKGNHKGNCEETMSLKALAKAVLEGNQQGNFQETYHQLEGNLEETTRETSLKVSLKNGIGETQGNRETFTLQTLSRDWRQFCDSHERSLPGSTCPLKRGRVADPFSGCIGWQLKNRRRASH